MLHCLCVCMPAFSNRGTVALSVGWISRIDLCKWTLWSEAFSASGNYRLQIACFLCFSTSLFPPLFPDVSSFPPLTLNCSSAALIPPFSRFPALSRRRWKTGETKNPICARVENGCRVSLLWWLCSCLLFLSLPFYNLARTLLSPVLLSLFSLRECN